jgi:hypothetical protein
MRWFFPDAERRLRHAAAHPAYAFKALIREATRADERFLAGIARERAGRIRRYFDEPARHPGFSQHLTRCKSIISRADFTSAELYAKKVLVQYAAIRALRPEVIVETGVANGVSTAYLLLALERNGKGILHSIEIGDSTYLPPDCAPGWVVPDWLRSKWTPHWGDARSILPELMNRLGAVDAFVHDSLHTKEHMLFEFEQAYPFIRPGGLLLADDALWNSAFMEFARTIGASRAQILHGVGVLCKEKH